MRLINKRLLVVFIFALIVRLISLDQSLWLDEATTAKVVQQYGFTQITSGFSPNDFHPPLYYLFMEVWTNLFGYSEVALRMPSVLFSLLTGYLVYLIGKKIDSGQARMTKQIGYWSAMFFLFNPLVIYYSQEARMYMMATFFLTTALFFFITICHAELVSASVLKTRSRNKFGMTKAIIMFNLFIILAFVTFYGSIFLIIPMALYLLYKKQYKVFLFSLLIIIYSLLILSPLLYQQFINAKKTLQIIPNWTQALGKTNLKNFLLIPLKFSIGRISFYPKWLYWGISGIWTLFIWVFIVKGSFKLKLLFYLFIGSLLSGILFSFFTPFLQYFRFIYLIPIMSILVAFGVKNTIYRYIIFFVFIVLSLIYLLNSQFHREDWKSLVKSIPQNKSVYMIYSSSDPVKYYRKNVNVVDLSSPQTLDREIVVIPYSSEIHGLDYQEILKKRKYFKKETKIFRQLYYEIWQKTFF